MATVQSVRIALDRKDGQWTVIWMLFQFRPLTKLQTMDQTNTTDFWLELGMGESRMGMETLN